MRPRTSNEKILLVVLVAILFVAGNWYGYDWYTAKLTALRSTADGLQADAHDASTASDMADVGTSKSKDAGKDADGKAPHDDASATKDAATSDTGNPYASPPVCTSGVMWTLGDVGSADMNPGMACDTCHTLGGSASGYEFDVAGTVYPTAHEPDECDGTATATVVITDAKQTVHMLAVNSAGNFYNFDYLGVGAIPTPFTVKVVDSSGSRAMIAPLTSGDCNICHTEQGTQGAPGRVLAP